MNLGNFLNRRGLNLAIKTPFLEAARGPHGGRWTPPAVRGGTAGDLQTDRRHHTHQLADRADVEDVTHLEAV